MAYDDTKWGGFAKIIVETSTLTAGDTVRVRSMTDANAIYDKTVVTAGTPLLFETEIFKDYVKICTVQDIGGVATEIGGVYRTVDYGQTLHLDTLNKSTLQGIKGILNAHQENDIMSIGDEVSIKINNIDYAVQVAEIDLYDSHEITFVGKACWDLSAFSGAGNYTYYDSSPATLRTKMQDFYNAMTAEDKALLDLVTKPTLADNINGQWAWRTFSDYVYPPNTYEVFAINNTNCPLPLHQFPIFTTQENRIKTCNGNSVAWWHCDGAIGSVGSAATTHATGVASASTHAFTGNGALPCFRISADA